MTPLPIESESSERAQLTSQALTPVIKAIIEAANETDQDISLKQVWAGKITKFTLTLG